MQNNRRLFSLFLVLISFTYVVYLFTENSHYISYEMVNVIMKPPKIVRTNEVKKNILLWNALPGKMSSILGTGRDGFIRMGCQYTNCYASSDRSASSSQPIHSYDAVVFNMNVLCNSDQKFPWLTPNYSRNGNQTFIFFSEEPAMYTWFKWGEGQVNPAEFRLFEKFFNWSMSYRKDADVPMFYGSINLLKSEQNNNAQAPPPALSSSVQIKNSTSTNTNVTNWRDRSPAVFWIASHCSTPGRREDYIRQLKRYIKVDSYGACGDLKLLCDKDLVTGDSPENCYDMLESKYKFYLSFENSICTDYVTEKFFRIIVRKIVPVVYGGADYSSIAPPHSYIDARLFEPQELADYLLMLDANETLYNEYFWWKDYYHVEAGQETMVKRGFCDLCKKLHLMGDNAENSTIKIYDKLVDHWLPENQCKQPKTYSSR